MGILPFSGNLKTRTDEITPKGLENKFNNKMVTTQNIF
jgi:hypothetical protein